MSDRATWTTTTHDWSSDLDAGHLAEVRAGLDTYGAGGTRHLILEVLAYANDEAESLGRVGDAVVASDAHGAVTVCDEGRGTDTRVDDEGRMIRKPIMATVRCSRTACRVTECRSWPRSVACSSTRTGA